MTNGDDEQRKSGVKGTGPAPVETTAVRARSEGKAAREARLAAALRDNLRRRKAAVAGGSGVAGDGRAGDEDGGAAGND